MLSCHFIGYFLQKEARLLELLNKSANAFPSSLIQNHESKAARCAKLCKDNQYTHKTWTGVAITACCIVAPQVERSPTSSVQRQPSVCEHIVRLL